MGLLGLIDVVLPKRYKNSKVLFEQNLDDWRKATEAAFATLQADLVQLALDLFGADYLFNNNGTPTQANSLLQQVINIITGATPITGTTSDTWTINTDGNYLQITTANLTGNRVWQFGDASDQVVGRNTVDTINNKTLGTATKLKGAGAGLLTMQYANTAASWTVTFPDPGAADSVSYLAATQDLSNKTLIGALTYLSGAGAGKATFAYANVATSGLVTFPDANGGKSVAYQDFVTGITDTLAVKASPSVVDNIITFAGAVGENKDSGVAIGAIATAQATANTAVADAAAAQATANAALPKAGGTMTGNIAMSGTQKLTGLAAGSGAGDSVRYEQLIASGMAPMKYLEGTFTGDGSDVTLTFTGFTRWVSFSMWGDGAGPGFVDIRRGQGGYTLGTGLNTGGPFSTYGIPPAYQASDGISTYADTTITIPNSGLGTPGFNTTGRVTRWSAFGY